MKIRKKKKALNFLNKYATLITISMSILAIICNGCIYYLKKASATEFYFSYLTVKIDSDDWINEYQKRGYPLDQLKIPTLNNSINQVLYDNAKQIKNFFVTYLIIEQKDDEEALNIQIDFEQYGEENEILSSSLVNFPVNFQIKKKKTEIIKYPFAKGEKIKIPVSICGKDNLNSYMENCYYIKLKPTFISYNNKYLFSQRKQSIREYLEHDVIIDGETVTGKGGDVYEDDKEKKWYLK